MSVALGGACKMVGTLLGFETRPCTVLSLRTSEVGGSPHGATSFRLPSGVGVDSHGASSLRWGCELLEGGPDSHGAISLYLSCDWAEEGADSQGATLIRSLAEGGVMTVCGDIWLSFSSLETRWLVQCGYGMSAQRGSAAPTGLVRRGVSLPADHVCHDALLTLQGLSTSNI